MVMVRCAALVVVFMFATCRLTFTVSVASVSVMTGTPLELSNLREVSQCPHASLKLTKIVFPTRASCHRTLLMCSSDKFSKLNQ